MTIEEKRRLIDPQHELSVLEQCEALGLPRSTFYYTRAKETEINLSIMRRIDEIYLETPFYGYRRMTAVLNREGWHVNEKRVHRLMKQMGIEAIGPKPSLSQPAQRAVKYPYLLRGLSIVSCNHVWSVDITYIPMRTGFIYLVCIMDWFSRYVLSWEISNTLDEEFCLKALERALEMSCPRIFNSDQGSQFTGSSFTGRLLEAGIEISWDGRGRALDNVFIERLWRSLKYEEVYPNCYESVVEAISAINRYLHFYNTRRLHQALEYRTPAEVYSPKRCVA